MTNPMTLQSDLLAPVLTLLDSAIYGAAELALVNAKEYQEAAERCNAIARVVNEARELLKGAELSAMARDASRYSAIRKGLSDYHGDVYAMAFQPDGDEPVAGANLDDLADRMVKRAAMANTQENGNARD